MYLTVAAMECGRSSIWEHISNVSGARSEWTLRTLACIDMEDPAVEPGQSARDRPARLPCTSKARVTTSRVTTWKLWPGRRRRL